MKHILYITENAKEFGKQLSKKLALERVVGDVKYLERQQFSDGEINVTFKESVRNESLIIVTHIHMPYENLFELLMICDAARRSSAKEIIVIVPYLAHARQERRDESRSPITSRLIADMLETAGVDHIVSMDIHTSAIEGFFRIPYDKLYATSTIDAQIAALKIEDLCLVSPDFGFLKKIKIHQDNLFRTRNIKSDVAFIYKERKQANVVETMELIGNVKGKNVVMIDDLIDTGGTLIKATDLLLAEGAKSVKVFATHGILSKGAIGKMVKSNIEKIYVSNTVPVEIEELSNGDVSIRGIDGIATVASFGKFNVMDVTAEFAKAIKKIVNNE